MNRIARKVDQALTRFYTFLNRREMAVMVLGVVLSASSGLGAWLVAAILLTLSLVVVAHALVLNHSVSRHG